MTKVVILLYLITEGSIKQKNDAITNLYECQRLVDLIEQNADELTRNFMRDVRIHAATPTYHTWDENELYERAYNVYSQLGKWISRETSKEEIAQHYRELGVQRKKEGFSLSEVILAIIKTRRHLWLKILGEGLLDTVLDHSQAMELNNRVILFFDRAIYYTILGYEGR